MVTKTYLPSYVTGVTALTLVTVMTNKSFFYQEKFFTKTKLEIKKMREKYSKTQTVTRLQN